jgi:anti-sigma regulatory factor (Ser/Thr protein kinase)
MTGGRVARNRNTVLVGGEFGLEQVRHLLAAVHHAVNESGYSDLTLDFASCDVAFPGPMLGLSAQALKWRKNGIGIELILPRDDKQAKFFQKANWANLIDPRRYEETGFRGFTQIPATRFSSIEERHAVVNLIVNVMLSAMPTLERKDFAALEWAAAELTDNVLLHAESPIGGLVQVSTFHKERKRVQFIVADAGLGIPSTIRTAFPSVGSDADTLEKAIREGVTRNKTEFQGNGLFGSYQLCAESKGHFQIDSGYGRLYYDRRTGLHIRNDKIPCDGTLISATIDCSVPHLLEQSLKFGGQIHNPVDYVELHYEQNPEDRVKFSLKEESRSHGSREAATAVRNKLTALLRMCPGQKIYIDFSDVPVVSSSFADEVFGKLFAQLGAVNFIQRFEFTGLNITNRQIVDRAIALRGASTART